MTYEERKKLIEQSRANGGGVTYMNATQRALNRMAQEKAEKDSQELWDYATTPSYQIPSGRLKENAISKISLESTPLPENAPINPTPLKFNPVQVGTAETVAEGVKPVTQEQYDAIMQERNQKVTDYHTEENLRKKMQEETKLLLDNYGENYADIGWFDRIAYWDWEESTQDRQKQRAIESTEQYYQYKYDTDASIQEILESLALSRKETSDSDELRRINDDISQITNVLYADTVLSNGLGDHGFDELLSETFGITGGAAFNDALIKGVTTGLSSSGAGALATVDATLGNLLKAFGWKNNPISEFNAEQQKNYQEAIESARIAWSALGATKGHIHTAVQVVSAMIPDVILAALSSGATASNAGSLKTIASLGTKSTAAQAAKAAITLDKAKTPLMSISKLGTGLTSATSQAFQQAAKNPFFWSTVTRSYGNDYNEAIEGGASQEVAYLYATITSLSNALVEVGGGVQVLPEKLQNKSKSQILQWIISSLEEGGEEVIQDVISDLNAKMTYDYDRPWISATDDSAVIDPSLIMSGAYGLFGGMTMGGGQVLANNIMSPTNYTKLGKAVRQTFNAEDFVVYASKSADEQIRELADKAGNGKLTNREIGVLYSYVASDVASAYKNARNLDEANNAYQMFEGAPKSIQVLAFSGYMSKLGELGITATSDIAQPETTSTEAAPTQTEAEQAAPKRAGISNLSARNKKKDAVSKAMDGAIGVQDLTEDQKTLKKIGEQFGARVEFANLDRYFINENGKKVLDSPNGRFDPNTNTITLNTSNKVKHDPVEFILKHEMTHSLEVNKDAYNKFARDIEASQIFKDYVKNQKGFASVDAWSKNIIDRYDEAGHPLGNDSTEKALAARKEMIADFVGDMLFGGKTKITEDLMNAMSPKARRSFIEWVQDFWAELKRIFAGKPELVTIEQLEKDFLKLARKVEKQNSKAEQSGSKRKQNVAENEKTTEDGETVDKNDGISYSLSKEKIGGAEYVNAVKRRVYSETRNRSDTSNERTTGVRKESWRENQARFLERAKNEGKQIVKSSSGDLIFIYKPAKPDGSKMFKVVTALNNIGIKTVYCDGTMESNRNNITQTHPEATTGPNGIIYFNKKSGIDPSGIAIHEGTHYFEKKSANEYNAFKNVVKSNLNDGSSTYAEFVDEIRKQYFENIAINNENQKQFERVVASELITYTNQYIATDYSKALEHFAPMFSNWDAVVEASKKFNDDIGLTAAIESSGIQYSIPAVDSNGNNLSNGQREYFNESKSVDDNGKLAVMYQGSAEEFYEFNRKKSSPYNLYGRGFYFTNSKSHAGQYGNVLREYYLDIKNPVATAKIDSVITKEQLRKYLEAISENEDYDIGNYGTTDIDKILNSVYGKSDFAILQDINATAIGNLVEAIELFNEVNGTKYDGIILATETVIFNSEQAKLTSNKNPTGSKDIRYSLPETDHEGLLRQFEEGKITRKEYLNALNGKQKLLNPIEIANTPKEAANTTPKLKEPKMKGEGDGQSKLHDSLETSDIITDDVKKQIEKDTYIKNYGTTTNKATLKEAMERLAENGRDEVTRFKDLPASHANAVDVAVGIILLQRYQDVGDTSGAIVIAEKLREIASVSGQTVQIFSVIGRFTPEMMVAYAQHELDKAFEIMKKKQTKKWLEANKDRFELTEEDIEVITRNTLYASELQDGSRTKAILLGEITTLLQDKLPPEKGQALRAWMRISLLFNIKTQLRNFMGNLSMVPVYITSDFFGGLIDKAVSQKTGVRTTGVNLATFGKSAVQGGKKGAVETLDDFKRRIHTKQQEFNRFEDNVRGGKSFNEHHKLETLNKMAKVLNEVDRINSMFLEMGDRPFFEMWFMNSLENQMRLNKTTEPTPQMMEIAKMEALQRTWQDDNVVSKTMIGFKKGLNKANIGGYGAGDVLLKFVKTPSNIFKAMVELSPIGAGFATAKLIKMKDAMDKGTFTPAMQKEVVRSFSNAITGTMLYLIVYALAASGAIDFSGDGDDDKDVSNFEKYVLGIPPYSFKFLGQNVTYSWNQPLGTVIAVVADIMQDTKRGEYDFMDTVSTVGEVFTSQSFLSNLYEAFSKDDLLSGLVSAVLSDTSAMIPTLFAQLASVTDPYRRTSYEANRPFKNVLNDIIYRIPGLRQTLPKQVNTLGEDAKNPQFANIYKAFISPSTHYPEGSLKVMDVATEVYALYEATSNKTVIPRVAPKDFKIGGKTVRFNTEEKYAFQKRTGELSVELLRELFAFPEYQELTDEEKIQAVTSVYDYATKKAKSELDIYDYEVLAEMEGKNKQGQYILKEETYNRLTDKAKQIIVDDYFFSSDVIKCKGDSKKLAKHFVKKSKN